MVSRDISPQAHLEKDVKSLILRVDELEKELKTIKESPANVKKANVQEEHDRIMALFENADDMQKKLADGLVWEAAKMRVQMDEMNAIINKTGYVLVSPINPLRQKELPISRAITKIRANYVAYIQRIRSLMDVETDDEYDGLEEYE